MNEIIEALTKAVSDACRRHPSVPTGPGGPGEGPAWNAELWSALDDIGVLLLPVPEDRGGAGGDLATTVGVLEVLGAESAAVPFGENALLAGWLLSECGAEIPGGVMTAAVAGAELGISRAGDDLVLDGRIARVPWGRCADHLVVLAGRNVMLLHPGQYEIHHGANLAGEPRDDVVFETASIGDAQIRPLRDDSPVDDESFAARTALVRAALMAGAARRAFELSTAYASERQQFGRSINRFQTVQQYLAAMAGEVLLCKVSAEAAAAALDRDAEHGGSAATAAMVAVSAAASTVARTAHQVHGAIGFTEEHSLRSSTTRIWSWRDEGGGAGTRAAQLGARVVGTGADGLWPSLTV
ncbi:acyl-CoA dehydrogenase family protein [Nocardioides alkalitolerans]|uniref:acyl-CoA dehydrogenase family protein n=1 Tax=Nocardioides alkalitolerans TaxID=281714 RepID=UPI00041EA0C1|nr:acyl-CoA dehydrogenase family protein [Nocardioides alkalitolerans]